jgi:hypothetical protein
MPTSVIRPALVDCTTNPYDVECGGFIDSGGASGGCFDPWDPFCGAGPPIIYFPPPIIVIENPQTPGVSPADLAGAINKAEDYTTSLVTGVKNLGIALGRAIAGVLSGLAVLWGVLKPVLQALSRIMAKFKRWLDKILRPILDAQRRQIKAILDLYNRFIRPWIIFIEQIRRVIHILQIFHIHVLDGLDRQLAKIEGKILRPIFAALYRANTLSNWISFILNARLLIFRGLFLGSLQANRGGAFSLLASTPAVGMPAVPETTAAGVAAPVTVLSLRSTLAESFTDTVSSVDDPTGDLARCWQASLADLSLAPGDPLGEMWACIQRSIV